MLQKKEEDQINSVNPLYLLIYKEEKRGNIYLNMLLQTTIMKY